MLKLCDLLEIEKENFCDYKVHFAIGAKDKKEPYDSFLIDGFKEWQEHQTQKNFKRKYVLSLIYYERDIWMFAGIYEILPIKPTPIKNDEGWHGWKYETKLLDRATDYIGRAFFRFKKEFRASYPVFELDPKNGDPIAEMPLAYLLEKRVTLADFAGFDSVNIDYKTLRFIVSDSINSWKTALSKVKGVYLIVDTHTGRQYIGSAYGDECIWQRWVEYAKNGHGGNVELKELLSKNGEDYRYNFKYSILEICNMNLGNDYIIQRESYWKEVLLTRKFGLNKN